VNAAAGGPRRRPLPDETGARPPRERGQRQRRVGEALRHALAAILAAGECRDPALREASITVSEVQLSPDLRNARVFVMPLGGSNAAEILAALARCGGFLRRRVVRDVPLRFAPQLVFAIDPSFDAAARISRLLASTAVERDLEPRDSGAVRGDGA